MYVVARVGHHGECPRLPSAFIGTDYRPVYLDNTRAMDDLLIKELDMSVQDCMRKRSLDATRASREL